MSRSPQQEALRKRSKVIKTPVKGSKDNTYVFDKKDANYYHVKYTPLRVSQVLSKSKLVEIEEASTVQKHRQEVYEELEFRGHFERRDVKATVLHDPNDKAIELSPQQRAANTRKENEEKAAKEEAEKRAKDEAAAKADHE